MLKSSLSFYTPFAKTDDEKRMVYGYASTEAVDSQGEVVKKDALKKAINDYMKFANIREMHQPSAVGKTKQANIDSKGLYIAAKVVDDNAWKKVKEGVYNGFSIGGRIKQMDDNEITDLTLSEISLVDRPANPEAVFDVYKADLEADMHKKDYSADERKQLATEGKALPDGSYPIVTVADLENAIQSFGRAKNKAKVKAHIIARAKDLKATDKLPADWEGSTKEEKADGAKDLKKSLGDIPWLTEIIASLDCLEESAEFEGRMEADPLDAEWAAKVAAANKVLVELLKERVERETDEMMGEEDNEDAGEPDGDEGDGGDDDGDMEMADKAKNLKKADEQIVKPDPAPHGTEEQVVGKQPEPAKPAEEAKPEEKPAEETAEKPSEEETPATDDSEDTTPGDKPEKSAKMAISELIKVGKMPSDDQVKAALKEEGLEVTDRTLEVTKYELAGAILEHVAAGMEDQKNRDALKADLEKVMSKAKVVGGEPHEFDQFILAAKKLVKVAETEMEKSTTGAVTVPEKAAVSPDAPNEQMSAALTALQEAVKALTDAMKGNAKTPDEEKADKGVKGGSEVTSENSDSGEEDGEMDGSTVHNGNPNMKVDAPEMKKLEGEVSELKEKLAKLENMAAPIKVHASYATVEKFDKSGEPKEELAKAEAELNDIQKAIQAAPGDQALIAKGIELSNKVMKLRRETK